MDDIETVTVLYRSMDGGTDIKRWTLPIQYKVEPYIGRKVVRK